MLALNCCCHTWEINQELTVQAVVQQVDFLLQVQVFILQLPLQLRHHTFLLHPHGDQLSRSGWVQINPLYVSYPVAVMAKSCAGKRVRVSLKHTHLTSVPRMRRIKFTSSELTTKNDVNSPQPLKVDLETQRSDNKERFPAKTASL